MIENRRRPEFWNSQGASAFPEAGQHHDRRIYRSEACDGGNELSCSAYTVQYYSLCKTSSSHFCEILGDENKNQRIHFSEAC